jgi:hypothetical protein
MIVWYYIIMTDLLNDILLYCRNGEKKNFFFENLFINPMRSMVITFMDGIQRQKDKCINTESSDFSKYCLITTSTYLLLHIIGIPFLFK